MVHPTVRWLLVPCFAGCSLIATAPAQQEAPPAPATPAFSEVQQRGVDFLVKSQPDGIFEQRGEPHPGVTALALAAVLTKPAELRNEAERAFVAKGSEFLLAQQNEDGSFGKEVPNYQTSAAVFALARLDTEAARAALAKAQKYLVMAQNAESNGISPDDPDYGSFGYGLPPRNRGDLSNTQFAIEALHKTGLDADHEAFRRAISFLQRTQNLRSVNDYRGETKEEGSEETVPVQPGDDGGAGYFPGNSKFGYDVTADGVRVPRSYGSMTYALLKTYVLCGLGPDDPRVKAATDWIRRNFSVEVNPGVTTGLGEKAAYQGLFYYYETMARALTTAGIDVVETLGEDKQKVDWRDALAQKLAATQREDGSWANEQNSRWWEDQPELCTIYALLALDDCARRPPEK
jgi:squalene-hopene/tetraprenyl-beta-curcumene cyclase